MSKIRNLLFYIVTIGGFSALIYFVISKGRLLQSDPMPLTTDDQQSSWGHFVDAVEHNVSYPVAILLLQIIVIILVARMLSFLCRKIGQPGVIGEIVAGIILGPSLLGTYFPEFSAFLFPASSLGNLSVLSQVGLVLFMFVVGMELDLGVLRNKAHEAVVISHASIILPFALGVILAYFIFQSTAPAHIHFISYALFIGISMSITAFPVLARIVQERGLTKTKLGSLVITCAAADDITAWCILAAVIAVVKAGSLLSAGYTILLAIAYVGIMLRFVRPFLRRIGDMYSNKEGLSKPIVGIFFIMLLVSSWTTEVIGIHALFGAFMAGAIMPPNLKFRNIFIEKVEDVALVLLLPLFFVFTGLRTQVGLISGPAAWELFAAVVAVAVTGKFLGSALAARFVGQSWQNSLTIGALMNTRGLMELIALNIGYDLGVISPEMFAILVLMALITTFMTGPALELIQRLFHKQAGGGIVRRGDKYNVLISFGNPYTGQLLVRLANVLTRKSKDSATVTALHLSPGNELNQFNAVEFESDSFQFIHKEAERLKQDFTPLFQPAHDIDAEITEVANTGDFDLLLVGIGQSVFEGTTLGKILGFTSRVINPERLYDSLKGTDKLFGGGIFDERTKHILKSVRIPTGVLIDKDLNLVNHIIVPIFEADDSFLLFYMQKLIQNGEVVISVLDTSGIIRNNTAFKESIRAIELAAPQHINLVEDHRIDKAFLNGHDLMLISLDSWKKVLDSRSIWLSDTPSVLIVKP
ncbi:transporter, CPA2 family [bacterium A37T11]|nr:transporter, CPA2 family [bacterium A37T11]